MVPGTALNVVCYALGGIVLAGAVVQLVRYFTVERGVWRSQFTLVSGLVCLGLGAFLILRSDLVVRALPVVFGLFVVFDSLGRVQNALELRRCQYSSWKGFLLLALLSVVLGIVMVVNPFGAMETLVMAIGVILIVGGRTEPAERSLHRFCGAPLYEDASGGTVGAGGCYRPGPERRWGGCPQRHPGGCGGKSRGVGYGGRERRGGDPPGGVMSRAAVCTA